MRNFKRNVTAFTICLGVVVTTFFSTATTASAAPQASSSTVSADLNAALGLDLLDVLRLNLVAGAGVNL